jgi:capsular polysaccharide transport system permease protein
MVAILRRSASFERLEVWSSDLAVSLRVMWNVVYALMLRESRTRYGKSDLGYTWAILNPLIQMLVLWLVYTLLGRHVPLAASMPVFLVTGILPFHLWRDSMMRAAQAVSSNVPLLTYPQVRAADVIIARTLLEIVTALIVALIFVVGLRILYGEPLSSWIDEPAAFMGALFALFYMSLSFAFLSSSLARIFPPWTDIFGYLSRPLWFTSGIFFTLQALPGNVRAYAVYNPVAHMLEWLRSTALPGFESDHYSPLFVLSTATVTLLLGLAIDRLLLILGHSDQSH